MFRSKFLLISSLVLALAASSSVWAQQYARPDGTLTVAGWSAAGAASLHEAVDEATAIDTDYIDSGADNLSTVILSLSSVIDPGVYTTNHILRYRCQGTGTGQPESCGAALYNGATLIADSGLSNAGNDVFATQSFTIPDASAINYASLDLRVRLTAGNLGGGESVQISWVELEVPNPTTVAPALTPTPTSTGVTDTLATLGGTVTNDNGTGLVSCGVEWGPTSGGPYPPYPTSQDWDGGPSPCSVGSPFVVSVIGLTASTSYDFRAWADNGATGYSSEGNFTTNPAGATPSVSAVAVLPGSITDIAATMRGDVTADGGSTVDFRGVRWGTATTGPYPNPVAAVAGGLGPYEVLVSGLPQNSPIYYVAYATNSSGTQVSSNEETFSTDPGIPTLDTRLPENIQATSADLGGDVTSFGGESSVNVGIVWKGSDSFNTSLPPDDPANGTNVTMGSVPDTGGPFLGSVGSLPNGTLVYFRAYATNSQGTAGYSATQSFTPADAPDVTSTAAIGITNNSAVMGGEVTGENGAAATDRGIVWNTTNVWNTANPPASEGTVWQMGSGPGIFTDTVTGLPTFTPIYFKAYAINTSGTSYSPVVQSFTTLAAPEPTVQASLITVDRYSARSMRISWTRGNGEGSIVVLRQGVSIVDPVDTEDYVPDSDFSQALALKPAASSENYVVHRAAGNEVWVTGLLASTTYSIAVYEYSGSGVNIDYLLGPATKDQLTKSTLTHNEDNGINCDQCHNHGSFNSRDTDLYNICWGCHNDAGDASNKLEYDNHLSPSKNLNGVEFVDCGVCHELHLPGTVNNLVSTHSITLATQQNKSFLRKNVDKYIPNAATPAYLHTDQPKRVPPHPLGTVAADTPDRAVEGGDATTARGYCQVCHTNTNYHRSTGDAPPIAQGDPECHDGINNNSCGNGIGATPTPGMVQAHCGECHQHNNSFQGSGGLTSCVTCHSAEQPPLPRPIITTQFNRAGSSHITGGSAVVTQPDCLVCHDQTGHSGDQIVGLVDLDDGTIYNQPTAGEPTISTGQGEAFAGNCMSCHGDGIAGNLDVDAGDGTPTTGQTRTSPFTDSGPPPQIDLTAWNAALPADRAAHNRPFATNPTSSVSCVGDGNNGCHASGHGSASPSLLANAALLPSSPAEGTAVNLMDFCINCHDADGPSSIDVPPQFTNIGLDPNTGLPSPTNMRTQSDWGGWVNQRHDVFNVPDDTIFPNYTDGDQDYSGGIVECKDCHSPHADNSSRMADPDTGIPLPDYAVTNTYTEDGQNVDYDATGAADPYRPEGCINGTPSENHADCASPLTYEPDYIQFCLTCHDGTPPPGVTMNTTDPLRNLAVDHANDYHGAGAGSGSGASTNKGGMKPPWVTTSGDAANNDPTTHYAALNCTTCHGAHGSDNIFNLRSSINVAGVQMTIGGVGNMPVPGRISDPTVYDLPRATETARNSGIFVQDDHYWGAWCSFCHKMDNGHASKIETDSCTKAHKHGGGSF